MPGRCRRAISPSSRRRRRPSLLSICPVRSTPSCRARIAAAICTSASSAATSLRPGPSSPWPIARRRRAHAPTYSSSRRLVGRARNALSVRLSAPSALAQSVREGGDPRVGADQGQVGIRIAGHDQELVADDLGPEAALAGKGCRAGSDNRKPGRPVHRKSPLSSFGGACNCSTTPCPRGSRVLSSRLWGDQHHSRLSQRHTRPRGAAGPRCRHIPTSSPPGKTPRRPRTDPQ